MSIKNWSHFSRRDRYIKDESGEYIKGDDGSTLKYIERCWCGKLVKSASWLAGCGADSDVVQVLTVVNKMIDGVLALNVLMVYNKKTNIIYRNINNSVDNDGYIDFFKSESGAVVQDVDTLPTVFTQRSSSKINSLDDALSCAVDLI